MPDPSLRGGVFCLWTLNFGYKNEVGWKKFKK